MNQPAAGEGGAAEGSFGAVSYNHLDVYKRQAPGQEPLGYQAL